ncbi:MAG: FAD-dependent oxidoreductase [Ilumatobacter sp.]
MDEAPSAIRPEPSWLRRDLHRAGRPLRRRRAARAGEYDADIRVPGDMTFTESMPGSSSIWTEDRVAPSTPLNVGLPGSTSVVVIGAGICGLVTASMLSDHGVDVVVIDARSSADSVTARSSAKVSTSHELTAAKIARMRGKRIADEYIEANKFGFEWIRRRVDERSIDCAWESRDAITYISNESSERLLDEEVAHYRRAGFDAEAETDVGLPYGIHRAIRVRDQGQFDPLAFLDSLVADLVDGGHHVVGGVRAIGVDRTKRGVVVRTSAGNIAAEHAVVTTGLPFLDRGTFFARSEPQSSYVLACEVESMPEPGMYLAADAVKRSLRSATTADGTEVLLVGGEGHKTGQGGDTEQRYATLAAWTNTHFGLREVTHRFMAQDYTTPDHLPYAGGLTPRNQHIHVSTGMNKWGFTNGPAAAAVNVARIVDAAAPSWSAAYAPFRLPASAVPELVKANANVATHLVGGWLASLRKRATPAPGQGHVHFDGLQPTATSSSRCDTAATSVSGVCPHLGAALAWNPAEETWDCPLHGSRFEADGRLLHGPATSDLRSAES